MNTVTDFIFLGSNISAHSDYSHEIKKDLLLGRKAITNLDSTLKSRNITLPTKLHLVKAMVFPVIMYGCENWTVKKPEHWRIDAFELWCWRRLLRLPWTARSSNQSILKEISPEYSLGRNDAEVDTPILWPPDARSWLIRKYPDAGKDWKQQEKVITVDEIVGWHHQVNGGEFEEALGNDEGLGSLTWNSPSVLQSKSRAALSEWTVTKVIKGTGSQIRLHLLCILCA